jgi:hypothetical protein
MAILNLPSFTKGSPATFTVNKTDLAALSAVAADPYFSVAANWSKIVVNYRASGSRQHKTLVFDATVSVPTCDMKTSVHINDGFQIHSIVIHDFDGGYLTVTRAGLPTALDFSFAPTLASFSGRYFEILMTDYINTAGGALVISELEIVQDGVAKTLSTMGATIVDHNFSITGNVSDGSFVGNAGNYMYSTATPSAYIVVDLGAVKTINGFAIGMTSFNGTVGANGLNIVPATVKLYKSDTVGTHLGGSLASTLTYAQSDWAKDTRKDVLYTIPAAPAATAYRYYKLQLLESFAGAASGSTAIGTSVSMSELKLKFDGAVQSLSALPVTGYSPSLGAFSDGAIHDDLVGTANDKFMNWSVDFIPDFTVDLGSAKVVTDVLIAPQGDLGAGQVYNIPKKFIMFGSNDGTNFTVVKVINQSSWAYGQAAGQWYPGQFTSFSLSPVVAAPLTGRYFEVQFDGLIGPGGSMGITENEIIIGGVAKTLATAGATILTQNFTGSLTSNSNGSFAMAGDQAYSTQTSPYIVYDLGSVQTIDGFAFGFGGFGTSDGMERVPGAVSIYASNSIAIHSTLPMVKQTAGLSRSNFTAATRKDF